MTLRIGHGNGHNRPELITAIRRSRADSFAGLETQKLTDRLERLPRHRVTVARPAFTEPRDRARSTCIVTRDDREPLGDLTLKVSERIAPRVESDRPTPIEKIAPDRVLVASFYGHPVADQLDAAGVAHFAVHPDAMMMTHDDPAHPIVREYREALESTRVHLAAARRDGYLIVLTGDLQATARFRAPWGPRETIADPLDLACRVVRIDWIMVDRRLRFAGPLDVFHLFDHDGFTAGLEAATGR